MIKGYYPITGINENINKLLRLLFSKAQAVQKDITDTVPTTDDIAEKELKWYKSSAGVIRLYAKVDGTLAYIQFTNV